MPLAYEPIPADKLVALNELIDHVRGTTCDLETESLEIVGIRMMDMPMAWQEHINDHVFECALCNWICDIDELSDNDDEQICLDCLG